MAKIQHIAIIAEDPEKLAHFYEDIYGMKITGRSQGDVWITDGYMDVAIIHKDNLPDQPTGINHFGFTIDPEEKDEIYQKMRERDLEPFDPRASNPDPDRPFVEHAAFDIERNRFDISTGMRDLEEAGTR